MPFKSKAQMRKFYADPQLRRHADKMLADTPGRLAELPERKRPPAARMQPQKRGRKRGG